MATRFLGPHRVLTFSRRYHRCRPNNNFQESSSSPSSFSPSRALSSPKSIYNKMTSSKRFQHVALTSLLASSSCGPSSLAAFGFQTAVHKRVFTSSNCRSVDTIGRRTFVGGIVSSNNNALASASFTLSSSASASSATHLSMADSVAELDADAASSSSSMQQHQSEMQQQQQQQQQLNSNSSTRALEGVATGEIISFLSAKSSSSSLGGGLSSGMSGGFAVVRVCEEDVNGIVTTTLGGKEKENNNNNSSSQESGKEVEGETVELASALFGKPVPKPVENVVGRTRGNGANGGVIADGDLTGRTVTFSNQSKGIIVAHRHPIAFVLLDSDNVAAGNEDDDGNASMTYGSTCSISTNLVSINPLSIPSGSMVDYLGRHVSVLKDGSVSRSLPKASNNINNSSISGNSEVDMEMGMGVGGIGADISFTVPTEGNIAVDNAALNGGSNGSSSRPIFVPIPKIADIGLIDSPLVTGITMFDALTPIGKGQNMLVIGQEEEDTVEPSPLAVNKRSWMMNLLKSVVENDRAHRSSSDGNGGAKNNMRCFYGLTSSNGNVRSNFVKRLERAGIQEDVVTVFSTHNDDTEANGDDESKSTQQTLEAAEAVAVAATACSLGEHHALTTGGDAVVIIDDINLHKSLWDITTQSLVQVYGVDAVVQADLQGGSSSEMRGYFSGLIQRAARFNSKRGGGSVTLILLSTLPGDKDREGSSGEEEATFDPSDFDDMSEKIKTRIAMLVKAKVPLTPTNLRKIQIPVPKPSQTEDAKRLALQHVEDLISMSDGQIWLDDRLAKMNRSPPLDPSRSMTRVGVGADTRTCRADAPALRSVVGSLRFEFQQAMDVMESYSVTSGASSATLSSSAASLSLGTAKQVQRRDAFLLAMHQEPNQARKLSHECIALLAASRGYLDQVLTKGGMAGTHEGNDAIDGLIQFVEKEALEVVSEIDVTFDMSLESRNILERAIESYYVSG